MLVLTSCVSTNPTTELPELSFPDFIIDVETAEITLAENSTNPDESQITVRVPGKEPFTVPLWFWLELVEYESNIHNIKLKYNKLKDDYRITVNGFG